MHIGLTIKINPTAIGQAMANASDDEQAAIINSFARELAVVCRGDTYSEMQICYFSKHLDKYGINLIKQIAEFIELRAVCEEEE